MTEPQDVFAEALRDLLDDTQHAEHDCGDTDCSVSRARAALALRAALVRTPETLDVAELEAWTSDAAQARIDAADAASTAPDPGAGLDVIHDLLDATEALPEDAPDPSAWAKRSLYAEGWADRGDAIRQRLAASPAPDPGADGGPATQRRTAANYVRSLMERAAEPPKP